MALLVLCDPTFKNSVWCERKLKGIRDEAARRRTAVKVFTCLTAFESVASKLGNDSSVIVLFSKISYIQGVAEILSRLSIHTIITNSALSFKLPFDYSRASTDIETDVRSAVEYLYSCGKKRIAMVAIDRNSWGDSGFAEMFSRYVENSEKAIFYADGDMQSCFDDFLCQIDSFDAVMLPNDHVAICFTEFLKEKGVYSKDLFVIGRGNSMSARLYGEGITSITTNFYNCGKSAAEAHFNRLKYGWESVNVKLKSQLVIRGSTKNIPYLPAGRPLRALDISKEVKPTLFHIPTYPIGRVDSLLAASDLTDLKLIYGILCGYSYERVSEFCFLSLEAAKYRVRKMLKSLACDSKTDATSLLSKYINKDNLLHTIEELEGENGRIFD